MRLWIWTSFVVLGSGCGGGDDGNGDGVGGAELEVSSRCAVIDSVAFPPVQVGQISNGIAQFTNAGTSTEGGLGIVIDGPDAAEFSISPFDSSCTDGGSLGAGEFCVLHIEHRGAAVGDRQATLHVGKRAVPLRGTVTAASTGLFSSIANLEYLAGSVTSGTTSFFVSNQGTTPITLTGEQVAIDGFLLDTNYRCSSMTLTPGAACEVQVAVAQLQPACVSGALTVTSSAGHLEIPVASEFVSIASVQVGSVLGYNDGSLQGLGRVTSDPPGIDCTGTGPRCAMRTDGRPITFKVASDEWYFNGWNLPRCGASTECTVGAGPLDGPSALFALFAPPDSKAIHVEIAGDGLGVVTVGGTLCTSSCTIYVPPGMGAGLVHAMAFSQFGGWSGGCTGSLPSCDLGLIVNDRDVTATFTKDPHEVGSTILDSSGRPVIDHLPGGDLLVASTTQVPATGTLVSRPSASGSSVWSTFLVGNLADAITTPGGAIYVLTGTYSVPMLAKLTAAGTVEWEIAPSVTMPNDLAALGEDVVVAGSSGIEARASANGTQRWTANTTLAAENVAVSPAGIIAASVGAEIVRYASDGTPLLPWTAPGPRGPWSLAYDGAGHLAALSEADYQFETVTTPAVLTRFAPSGTPDFSLPLDSTGNAGGGDVVITPTGKIATLRMHHGYQFTAGASVEVFGVTGAREWMVEKWGARTGPGSAISGFGGGLLRMDPDGNILMVGYQANAGLTVLETFAP
ncbi:MAG: Ig domain protein group 2 domain protein [Myxococcales bacterium]|nr:Ig domain protein group 2 domain protein [Myxococcales bacterium]